MMYVRLAAVAVFLGVVALVFYYRAEAVEAEAAHAAIKLDLATATAANKAYKDANDKLEKRIGSNDRIVASLADTVSQIRSEHMEAVKEIANLKDTDDATKEFLIRRTPDALRVMLDKRQAVRGVAAGRTEAGQGAR